MYFTGTEGTVRPDSVSMCVWPDGRKCVRLSDNIQEIFREDDQGGQIIYVYDEVLFELDADRTETVQDIEENFEDWWIYGSEPEEAPPTVEERLDAIEELMMEMLGGE